MCPTDLNPPLLIILRRRAQSKNRGGGIGGLVATTADCTWGKSRVLLPLPLVTVLILLLMVLLLLVAVLMLLLLLLLLLLTVSALARAGPVYQACPDHTTIAVPYLSLVRKASTPPGGKLVGKAAQQLECSGPRPQTPWAGLQMRRLREAYGLTESSCSQKANRMKK